MRLADSHCHLTDDAFGDDLSAVLDRARAAGVERIVTVASDAADAGVALELARGRDDVWCTAGVHPHAVGTGPSDDAWEALAEVAAHSRCAAVGETGLDYHYDHAPRRAQRESFRRHAELAAKAALPLVVHSRDAAQDTAAAIREAAGAARGVLHCFSGPPALLEVALDSGWMVSFTGIVAFRGFDAGIVRAAPRGRYMIETDSPYLAPPPRRGKRNEPAMVRRVAEIVAALRGETPARVAADSWIATARFFGLEGGDLPDGGSAGLDGESSCPDAGEAPA